MPSIPGAVHPFLLATSFLTFVKGHSEVIDTVYLLIKLSSYFLHPWHIRCSFFSLPYTTPEIHKFVHVWHLPFLCPIFFQCLEESFLVALEHDIILLPSLFLRIFYQLYFLVPHLVQPYFSHISQVGTCHIFLIFSP